MSNYVGKCRKCGMEMEGGNRRKVALLAELSRGKFSTAGWAFYLCPQCAEEANKLLGKWCS